MSEKSSNCYYNVPYNKNSKTCLYDEECIEFFACMDERDHYKRQTIYLEQQVKILDTKYNELLNVFLEYWQNERKPKEILINKLKEINNEVDLPLAEPKSTS